MKLFNGIFGIWNTSVLNKKTVFIYWFISAVYSVTVAVESVLPVIFFDQIASWSVHEEEYSANYGLILCIVFFVLSAAAKIITNKCHFAMDNCITRTRSVVQRELHRRLFAVDYEITENESFWRENFHIFHMADTSSSGMGAMMQQLYIIQGLCVSFLFSWCMLIHIHNAGYLLLGMFILWYSIKKEIAVEKESVAQHDAMDRSAKYIMNTVSSVQYAKEIRVLREWGILKRKLVCLFEKMICLDREVCRRKFRQRFFMEHILFLLFSLIYMFSVWQKYHVNEFGLSSVFTAFFLLFTVGNTLFKLTESIVLFAKNSTGLKEFANYSHTKEKCEMADCQEKNYENMIEWDLKNVSYCYPHRDEFALKNFTVQIKRGEKIAVVGLNGAGKSTLIKCMTGLYHNYTGCIIHNGNVMQGSGTDRTMGVLFQDAAVYPFTIEENAAGCDARIDHDKVVRALEQVGLMDKFRKDGVSLTECIDKLFSETGIELSGGENKKLLLARILYKNPETVILDEPASSLDICAQEKLMALIRNLFQDKTVIVVTHRMEMLGQFERILVLENGSLIEDGRPEELLKNRSRLSALMDMQENKI